MRRRYVASTSLRRHVPAGNLAPPWPPQNSKPWPPQYSKPSYAYACNSSVTTHCQIYDQTKFHMVKGIHNAFDHMELCFVL